MKKTQNSYNSASYKKYSTESNPCQVYNRVPINYVVRLCRWLSWIMLRSFYWVGLVDNMEGECFTWSSFYRIKVKR